MQQKKINNNFLVSVVIPTRNSQSTIVKCLQSIKGQSYKNIEIIVVDNNSNDKTRQSAFKYTSKVYNKGPERSAQRNFGASKAKGEYLLFIDSDMSLGKNVVGECVQIMNESKKIYAVVIPEISWGKTFWAKCKTLERSFYLNVEWMEAARFFRSQIFKEFNGYDQLNTGTEDYDLPQRINEKYGGKAISRITSYIYHDDSRISLISTCRKKMYYAKNISRYKKIPANSEHFRKQSSIFLRYRLFFSDPKKLFRNPGVAAGMIFMKTCEFAAGGIGYLLSRIAQK